MVALSAWALLGPGGERGPGRWASTASRGGGHGTQNAKAAGEGPRAVPSAQGKGQGPLRPQARGSTEPLRGPPARSPPARPEGLGDLSHLQADTWLLGRLAQGTELAHRHRGGRHCFHGFGTGVSPRIHFPLGPLDQSQSESLSLAPNAGPPRWTASPRPVTHSIPLTPHTAEPTHIRAPQSLLPR